MSSFYKNIATQTYVDSIIMSRTITDLHRYMLTAPETRLACSGEVRVL